MNEGVPINDKKRLEIGLQAIESLKKEGLLDGKTQKEQRELVLNAANAIKNEEDRVKREAGNKPVELRNLQSPEESNEQNRKIEQDRLRKEKIEQLNRELN